MSAATIRDEIAATIAQFWDASDSPEDAADAVLALFTVTERVNDDGWASSMTSRDGQTTTSGRASSRSAVLTERARSPR